MTCPMCEGTNTQYALFSGGKEMFCEDCGENFMIPADEPNKPRAALLQTEEGRTTLQAELDQELARRRDEK